MVLLLVCRRLGGAADGLVGGLRRSASGRGARHARGGQPAPGGPAAAVGPLLDRHGWYSHEASLPCPGVHVPSPEALPAWPGRDGGARRAAAYVRDTPATAAGRRAGAVRARPRRFVAPTGPTSPRCSPSGSTARRSTCPASAGAGRPAATPSTAMADRVIRWIEHTDRGPVHLFGNSMGGAVVGHGRRHPSRPGPHPDADLAGDAVPRPAPVAAGPDRAAVAGAAGVDRLAARRMAAMTAGRAGPAGDRGVLRRPDGVPEQRLAEAIEEAKLRTPCPGTPRLTCAPSAGW